jgi:hypothetical protein
MFIREGKGKARGYHGKTGIGNFLQESYRSEGIVI